MSIYEKADQALYFVLTENLTVIVYFTNEMLFICIFVYYHLYFLYSF